MIRTIIFWGWFFIALLFKIPSRFSFLLGVIILIVSSGTILLDHQGFALRLTTYAFGFLLIGCVSYIREIKQHET